METTQSSVVQSIPLDDLHTPEDFAAAHSHVLRLATLRHQLRHRFENGLAAAVVPVGKRLLISRRGYETWLSGRTATTMGANRG